MVRILKQVFFLAGLAGLLPAAFGFALLGPVNEAYQVGNIGYNLPGDIGAPKNLGEEYRWSKPVLYYSCDDNFITYFGASGVAAIDSAYAVLNQLTNVSSYSQDLSEFPMESMRVNYQAEALGLFDLKSLTLSVMVEQMGLAEPERWVWCIHNRYTTPGGQCPQNQVYDVFKRNFDPVPTGPNQVQSSSYVNGNLFSYQILEACTGPDPLADAVEFPVDPLANVFSAVASFGAGYGNFYLGLTRDDVGGMRYLMRTNNYNIESAGADTLTYVTNTTPQLLFTSNLTQFAIQALTNDPGTLSALYPNLQIASSTPIFTNVVTTNTIFYFTNRPFDPAGSPAALVTATERTTNVAIYWSHQFLNVYITPSYQLVSNTQIPLVPGHTSTNRLISLWTTNITAAACGAYQPYGTICTNISAPTVLTNGVFGDYYILPSNLCAVAIVSTQLIAAITVTNGTFVATNAPGTTNAANEFFSQTPTYTFNQYIYVIRPVVCPPNTVGLRQGIDRVRFERRDFDSLLGRFFYPVTNQYTLVTFTNNTLSSQTVQRVVTAPDFLLTAQDTSPGPGAVNGPGALARNITYNQATVGVGLAGPGNIEPGTTFIYNKVGPIYENDAPNFLDEAGQLIWFIWASFDGSTNAPIVYPNGTSIEGIENQIFIQINPAGPVLPGAQAGVAYSNSFTVTGGTPPFIWSAAGLPLGLTMNSTTGQITGTPAQPGVFDFSIHLLDSTGRFIDRPYTISVSP